MSRENVEATKLAVAALNRGDFEGLEELYAADAVLQDLQNAPDQPVTIEGVQAIRQTLNLWAAAFDELRVDIEEYIDGPNAVICAAHWQGQGKTSGISIDVHQFDLYEFREGKVVRAILGFRSKNEALEAAGLSEQAMWEENVETARRFFGFWPDRDFSAVEEFIRPDTVIDMSRTCSIPASIAASMGSGTGLPWSMKPGTTFARSPRSSSRWATPSSRPFGFRVLGARVACNGMLIFGVWRFQQGKVARYTGGFRDRDDALEAAGHSE